jgi:hypothetical protein
LFQSGRVFSVKAIVFGAGIVLSIVNPGICQENRPYLNYTESPRLYFTVPASEGIGRVEFVASSAELNLLSPADLSSADTRAVLQLRGNVEVTMCSPVKSGCDKGVLVLHADAVDYNEKTGDMDVRGDVHLGPYRPLK